MHSLSAASVAGRSFFFSRYEMPLNGVNADARKRRALSVLSMDSCEVNEGWRAGRPSDVGEYSRPCMISQAAVERLKGPIGTENVARVV